MTYCTQSIKTTTVTIRLLGQQQSMFNYEFHFIKHFNFNIFPFYDGSYCYKSMIVCPFSYLFPMCMLPVSDLGYNNSIFSIDWPVPEFLDFETTRVVPTLLDTHFYLKT